MNEFEPIRHYQYPDESQSLRIKEMTEISAGAGMPHPERVATDAEVLGSSDPTLPPESFQFVPTLHNKGFRNALWTLNTYKLRLCDDGTLAPESHTHDWEVADRDRRLARVCIGKWHLGNSLPSRVDANDPLGTYMRSIKNVELLDAQEEVELSKDIEAGLYAVQSLEGGKANANKKLSDTERKQLAEVARVGKDAFDHMFEANLALVVSIAKKYRGLGVPFADLIQEGNIGLRHGVEKFDYKLGIKFSTYASRWIEQAMQTALASQSRVISVTRHERANLIKIYASKNDAMKTGGIELSVAELAKRTGIDEESVVALLNNYDRVPLWLDKPISDESHKTLQDVIYDADDAETEDVIVEDESQQEMDSALKSAFAALTVTKRFREKVPMYRVIETRYGFEDGKLKTQEETAKILGLGRNAVYKAEKDALEFMRQDDGLRDAYINV